MVYIWVFANDCAAFSTKRIFQKRNKYSSYTAYKKEVKNHKNVRTKSVYSSRLGSESLDPRDVTDLHVVLSMAMFVGGDPDIKWTEIFTAV